MKFCRKPILVFTSAFHSPLQRGGTCAAHGLDSEKTCIFSSILAPKTLCCKSADIDFVSVFPIQNGSRALFFKFLFVCILGPKKLPKTLPKPGPNPLKIDAKNVLFFNIDFFGFGTRFWRLLGLQLGAKLALRASKNFVDCPFLPS